MVHFEPYGAFRLIFSQKTQVFIFFSHQNFEIGLKMSHGAFLIKKFFSVIFRHFQPKKKQKKIGVTWIKKKVHIT